MQRIPYFRLNAILLIIGVLCLAVTQALRASYVSLHPAPALSGQIAQAAQTANTDSSLPAPGKDFTLHDVHYFSNNTWAVASFQPTNNQSFNAGLAVLQKQDGIFRVVLGPSSTLSADYASSLPPDLVTYLDQKGLFE